MTGGQDWASELIETGGKEVNIYDLGEMEKRRRKAMERHPIDNAVVRESESLSQLAKRLSTVELEAEELKRRVQEIELKNTCFGPLKPSGSSAADPPVRCAEQVTSGAVARQFFNQAECVALQKADKPKREWWALVGQSGVIITATQSKAYAERLAAPHSGATVVQIIPAPTDAEIAAASLVACENYLAGNSFDKSLEAFANHLLGRTER